MGRGQKRVHWSVITGEGSEQPAEELERKGIPDFLILADRV